MVCQLVTAQDFFFFLQEMWGQLPAERNVKSQQISGLYTYY